MSTTPRKTRRRIRPTVEIGNMYVRLGPELYAKVVELAAAEGSTVSGLARGFFEALFAARDAGFASPEALLSAAVDGKYWREAFRLSVAVKESKEGRPPVEQVLAVFETAEKL